MIWSAMVLLVAGTILLFEDHGSTAQLIGVVGDLLGLGLLLVGLWRLRHRAGRFDDSMEVRLTADYRTSRKKIVAMILVVVYLISPVDLALLAFLLPVGVVGDATAMAWLLVATGREVSRHHRARRLRRELGYRRPAANGRLRP